MESSKLRRKGRPHGKISVVGDGFGRAVSERVPVRIGGLGPVMSRGWNSPLDIVFFCSPTWTRKISCYLCCFFGGCHWLPRRMKYQERPYNRTPLHSREAGREQTKTPQHIPFRLFYSQVPFQMHFKVPKKRHTYRSDRFCRINCHALSFLHRGGFVSRRCICSFNGDDARAPWPCNPPRIGRPCRR